MCEGGKIYGKKAGDFDGRDEASATMTIRVKKKGKKNLKITYLTESLFICFLSF